MSVESHLGRFAGEMEGPNPKEDDGLFGKPRRPELACALRWRARAHWLSVPVFEICSAIAVGCAAQKHAGGAAVVTRR